MMQTLNDAIVVVFVAFGQVIVNLEVSKSMQNLIVA